MANPNEAYARIKAAREKEKTDLEEGVADERGLSEVYEVEQMNEDLRG
jgi:hypothetical protein